MNPPLESQTAQTATRPPIERPTTQMILGCLIIPTILVILALGAFAYVRATASTEITIPAQENILVHSAPDSSAPILARFGGGQKFTIAGRTSDWRWLEVNYGANQRGWVLRPLHILIWKLDAPETTPDPNVIPPPSVTPVPEVMISIPATSFTMGSPPGQGEVDERPAHSVTLSAFEIDQTEVTLGQYWQCVLAGVCLAPTSNGNSAKYSVNDPRFDNYPITNVPWAQADHYCTWRGKRLPTEAEWELAAGWDTKRNAKLQWPWGNTAAQGPANLGDGSIGAPGVVGSFPGDVSPWGVMDMGGNVSEWVFDAYKVDYYSESESSNPKGPISRRGQGTGRVVRGASFATSVELARTTNRDHQEVYGYPTIGFRCAKSQ